MRSKQMGVNPKKFVEELDRQKVAPLIMVPCSIFKSLTDWILINHKEIIFPPNEAHAIGFASGAYLATGVLPSVFIQNSGLNNIANAQTSLNLLYKIPVLLFISWRGKKSEAPEHDFMGANLLKLLRVLNISYQVLSDKWQSQLKNAVKTAHYVKTPYALIVSEGFFEKIEKKTVENISGSDLPRHLAIEIIKKHYSGNPVFVSSTGGISRESFVSGDGCDFYMMGSMGHTFSVGVGLAWSFNRTSSDQQIVILDGDGSCLMHLGSLALVNHIKRGLIYIVLDNECYETTGCQPSLSSMVDFSQIASGLGFKKIFEINTKEALLKTVKLLSKAEQPVFVHIKVGLEKINSPRVSDKYTCQEITERLRRKIDDN